MLKIFGRIVMILCVAGLISGGLYFFINSTAGQRLLLTDRRGGFERQVQANQAGGSTLNNLEPQTTIQGRGFGEREFRGEIAPQRAVAGIVQNVAVIALITFVVVTVQKVISMSRRKGSPDAA
jgi:hypothetical protein